MHQLYKMEPIGSSIENKIGITELSEKEIKIIAENVYTNPYYAYLYGLILLLNEKNYSKALEWIEFYKKQMCE